MKVNKKAFFIFFNIILLFSADQLTKYFASKNILPGQIVFEYLGFGLTYAKNYGLVFGIGEELGFIGAAFIILLYGILIVRAIIISYSARDFYGTLVVIGISAMWLFHIFENIGMSIGLMPITGIPLPFLSYGGSSLMTNMLAVGLILSINIRGKKIVF